MAANPIENYYRTLDRLKRAGHSQNEGALSPAFHNLLSDYCRAKNLELVAQVSIKTPFGTTIRPDGIIRDSMGVHDWGYWESKDTKDNLEDEIQKKFGAGYPKFNILFEDSQNVVLIQDNDRLTAKVDDPNELDKLLKAFINY
ncbi:MAG: hypothetical protein FMNOHCHN_03029 [Ignavibacteriaceae bacterium]|nr:hypothetical protein [Ignavibacteriaceae bacterium]